MANLPRFMAHLESVEPLDQAAEGYEMFKHKQDECNKVVLTP